VGGVAVRPDESFVDRIYLDVLVRDDLPALVRSTVREFDCALGLAISREGSRGALVAEARAAGTDPAQTPDAARIASWMYNAPQSASPLGVFTLRCERLDDDARSGASAVETYGDERGGNILVIEGGGEGVTHLVLARAKNSPFAPEMLEAAAAVRPHFSRALRLATRRRTPGPLTSHLRARFDLTQREAEIVATLNGGRLYQDVCDHLAMSRNTLKWHMKNIFQKADVSGLPAMIAKVNQP